MRVALIGASGFIGMRTAEVFHLGGVAEVRPVVRSTASLAVLARMRLDWRVCDLMNAEALTGALRDCTVCVHAAIGDSSQIVRMAVAAYESCVRARVPRLVWLSSASVHGQNPPPGTDETSPLNDRQPFDYNNAKVRAEWALDRLGRDGRVEVVKLRPSIVYGPRSRWVADVAVALLNRHAAWIDAGEGICNLTYVDNLVEAIRLAAVTRAAAGGSFLVGDTETVRWRQFMLPIAECLGLSEADFKGCHAGDIANENNSRLVLTNIFSINDRIGALIPKRAKRILKALGGAWREKPPASNPWALDVIDPTHITPEMSQLQQQCKWKLPNAQAERILKYNPHVLFSEGMSHSLAWLDFAGFPVKASNAT